MYPQVTLGTGCVHNYGGPSNLGGWTGGSKSDDGSFEVTCTGIYVINLDPDLSISRLTQYFRSTSAK